MNAAERRDSTAVPRDASTTAPAIASRRTCDHSCVYNEHEC